MTFEEDFKEEGMKHMIALDEICNQYAGRRPSEEVSEAAVTIITMLVMGAHLDFDESKQMLKDLNLLAQKMYQAGHVEGTKSVMPNIGRG